MDWSPPFFHGVHSGHDSSWSSKIYLQNHPLSTRPLRPFYVYVHIYIYIIHVDVCVRFVKLVYILFFSHTLVFLPSMTSGPNLNNKNDTCPVMISGPQEDHSEDFWYRRRRKGQWAVERERNQQQETHASRITNRGWNMSNPQASKEHWRNKPSLVDWTWNLPGLLWTMN